MAEAVVAAVLQQLISVSWEEIRHQLRLGRGVEKDVQKLTDNFMAIKCLLKDADKRRITDEPVRYWLDRLKDVSFQIDDVLDHWNTLILQHRQQQETKISTARFVLKRVKKVRFFHPFQVRLQRSMAKRIRDLNQKLDEIALQRERYGFKANSSEVREQERSTSTSLVDESNVVGRDVQKEALIGKLVSESSGLNCLEVIPIVGMGGIGKTTLAQIVYNSERVKNHFEKRIWVCVSDHFEMIKIAKAILESLNERSPDSNELEYLHQEICTWIKGKRFLLVLDDVWTEDEVKWEQLTQPLRHGASGSKLLVTTRKETVTRMMGIDGDRLFRLEILPKEFCWSIFSQRAFLNRSENEKKGLESMGRQIALKSKGLPLLAKALGGMCSRKSMKEWQEVLQSELWKLKEKTKIFVPFLLSYDDLSPQEKCCLLYCSIFPKDHEICVENLIQMWMSQGYVSNARNLETNGLDCFNNLAMRSFFQDFGKDNNENTITCKMHDIVHDFVQFISKDEFVIVDDNVTGDVQKIRNARHVTISTNSRINLEWLNKWKMRTLLFIDSSGNSRIDVDGIPDNLKYLRTLDLSGRDIAQLPINMNKMMHLRYLNLSYNWSLEACHESVCNLFNLQTLRMSFCHEIRRLPEGIGKLENLQHLDMNGCSSLEGLPTEIVSLICLQTLRLSRCSEIRRLPQGIGKLKNLQHLDMNGCSSLEGLPTEIESLTCLRTLRLSHCNKIRRLPQGIGKLKNLQHLDMDCCSSLEELPTELESLNCLQTLRLSWCTQIRRLPDGIGKLKNIRHLDMDHCLALEGLPTQIESVICLQTLRLSGCSQIRRLPEGIGKISNLQHLYIQRCSNLEGLPKEIKSLKCLQTLDMYVVPTELYARDKEALSFADLSILKLTQHSLHLSGCERIQNPDEAESGELKSNEFLKKLVLDFRGCIFEVGGRSIEEESRILEALQPHTNLTSLKVSFFGGDVLPNWITGLIHLKEIELFDLHNCETLPPLGKLPSLESLEIRGMMSLKKVGIEFLGVVEGTHDQFISFPKLKKLHFHKMFRWDEWECEEDCKGRTIMPQLASLDFRLCVSLRALPDFLRRLPLQKLDISGSSILKGRCKKGVGEDTDKISHIPQVLVDF